ncbi:MAG TPA: GNAT family N-acetyltransferase [Euzebyales bacterium]|nr:GNAT family N-acetyltransferase [Euzebyales bacterium]
MGVVAVRDVGDGDVEVFFEHQRDPEATRMAAFPAREWEVFVAHWRRLRADATVVTRTVLVDGQVAGNVVSWEQSGRRRVGYWIGREHWGRGVATRALGLFLGQLRTRPLYADVAVHNVGSMRVLERCGFERVHEAERGATRSAADDVEEVTFVLES